MKPSTSSTVGGILLMVGNLLDQRGMSAWLGSSIGGSLQEDLLVMNATLFEATRVVDGTVMADVYHVLNSGAPILHEYMRAMSPTEVYT
jgi:hypothetical protein